MIDFHTHILPGIDDGSKDAVMSVEMIRAEMGQGVDTFVFTPHFYASHNTPERFVGKRAEAFDVLQDALSETELQPAMLLGSEVFYYPNMGQIDATRQLAIGETGVILVEPPFEKWTVGFYRDIENLNNILGLQVVIAHIERYTNPFNIGKTIERLKNCGALIQSNAEFFVSLEKKRLAFKTFGKNGIDILGSDCHNMHNRAPNMGCAVSALSDRFGTQYIDGFLNSAYDLLNIEVPE